MVIGRSITDRFPIGSDPLDTEWVPMSNWFEQISASVYIGNGQIKKRYNGVGSTRGFNADRLRRCLCVCLSVWYYYAFNW